jgi:hypothetical protein
MNNHQQALTVKENPSIFTLTQLTTLLSAVEITSTLSSKSLATMEVVLSASLAEAREPHPSSPPELLKRSSSGLKSGTGSFSRTGTAGSGSISTDGFSFVGSSMFQSQVLGPRSNGSTESSGVLVKSILKRGWDWRSELESRGVKEVHEEIVRKLRWLLGNEVAGKWVTG